MGYITPLLFAAFVAFATAGPAGLRNSCANTCSSATKFEYETGMSYEYDYQVKTTTSNSPTDFSYEATLTVNSKAIVSVIAPCEFLLTLSDVTLKGSPQSSEFSSELTKKSLRFGFDDGRISEVCSETEEEAWITNFKRGVLSAFQNSMDKFDESKTVTEIDVTGECKTNYEMVIQSAYDTITIRRTKSSDSCQRIPVSSHTSLPLALQRLPLLSGEQQCTQKIVSGVLKEADCSENLILRPVSGSQGGATTNVHTILKLARIIPGLPSADFEFTKSTLLFDGAFDTDKGQGYFRTIDALLAEINRKSMPFLQPEVPALFSQLVENLRHLDHDQLTILYEANKASRVWRFLVDAAPMVATSASTAVVVNLISNGQMTTEEADIWYTSLAFVTNPDAQMFTSLPQLLTNRPTKKALLGISALINNYCKKESSCTEDSTVREVLSAIELNLGTACRSSNLEEKEYILVTLKALGNAGHWVNNEVMEQCYLEKENPAEVRVATLEAWRRAPCTSDRSRLLEIYLDSQEDSEIRIVAYLSLMACPDQTLIDNIKDRLTSESVNQVGSFVWTHLSNLQETASHEKQWIRSLIGEDLLVNKFNVSSLKFSRNYESSFYMEELGLGTTMEGNMIFSTKSFLPRSGMFNLTFDFFGESINMLEVGGRIEGFEVFAEKFFGPQGYYPEETVEGILRSLRQTKSNQETTIEEMLDVITDEPEGSYYLRVFGNDVQYHHFRGIENFFENKPEFNLVDMLMEFARNGNVDYTKSYKLIDTELSYPTAAGFPLTLKINSTATIGLRMDGKFSMRSFRDVDIAGHIYPSAAVQVDATILVDAHVIKSGLKVTSNVHTSSFIDGNLKIEGGKVIDFVLNVPEDKIELINVKTEKIYIGDIVDHATETKTEPTTTVKCMDSSRLLGLQVCTKLTSGSDNFESSLYIEKRDSHTGYVFRYLKEENQLSLLIDTPGSSIDRKFSLTCAQTNQRVSIDIHTPWKSFKASGSGVVDGNGKHYDLKVTADDTHTYQIITGYSVNKRATTTIIEPVLIVKTQSSIIVKIEGTILFDSRQNTIKIDLHNKGVVPVSFKYTSVYANALKKIETSLESPYLSALVSGMISHEDEFLTQLDVKYSIMGRPERSFSHHLKFDTFVNDEDYTLSGALLFQLSEFPEISLDTKGRISVSTGRIESSGSINYGSGIFDLATDNTITYLFEEGSKSYDIRMALTSASLNIDSLLTEKFVLRQNYLLREAYLRLTPAYELESKTEMGYSPTDGFARFKIIFPNYNISHDISYSKLAEKYYTIQVLGSYNGNINCNFDGSYKEESVRGKSTDIVIGLKGRINHDVGDANLVLKADDNGVLISARSTFNGVEKFAKIETTPTSIEIDANILKHVTLMAQVHRSGPVKSVSLRGTWDKTGDATDIAVSGSLDRRSISGLFRFGTIEKKFRGEIEDNSIKVEIQLEPSKVIIGRIAYHIQEYMDISASLETPFAGYEKQDASVMFKKINNNEFTTQISLTWKNSQLLAFSATGKIESNYNAGNMSSDIKFICDESIFGFENFALELKHRRNERDVDSTLSVTVDGEEIVAGVLKSTFTRLSQHVEAKLITPFSDELSYKFMNILFEKGSSELHYGSKYIMQSYMKTPLSNNTGIQITYSWKSSFTEDLQIQFSSRGSNNRKIFELNGGYGEHKGLATFTLDTERSIDSLIYSINARVVVPFMTPITGSIITTVKNYNQYLVDIEITRFWSSSGSVKLHANLTLESDTKVQFVTSLTSPDVRASVDSLFKYENGSIDTYLRSNFNGMRYGATLKGFVDIQNKKVSLSGALMTPDTNLKLNINGSIDFSMKSGHCKLMIGSYETSIEFRYTITTPFLEIISPFEMIKYFKLSSHIDNIADVKMLSVSAGYYEHSIGLLAKYSPNDINEVVMFGFNCNQYKYKVSGGYEFADRQAYITLNLQTPSRGLTDIRFTGKIDLANEDKTIEITLQNEDDHEMIALNGKFISGDMVDIKIRSPFSGLENFHTYGSLNRSKRSLEFSMQNDSSRGVIRASFNSLDINVKTPYEAAREASLHILRTDQGGLEIHYKRGDNFVDIKASPRGRRQSFDITVNTAFPGWEVLALTGRLDKDKLIAYLSGQINEAKMTIEGQGTYSRIESDLKFDITTPYDNYKSLTVTLAHNLRRKYLKVDVGSSSSNFKIYINTRPNLEIDIFVPNSSEPTIIKASITIFSGSLTVNSRFTRMRSFSLSYNVSFGQDEIKIASLIENNGVELFKLEFERGSGKAHLMIHARRGENHSMLHFHRVGFETAEFIFNRNGKEFKAEAQGTGNLPTKGSIDIAINNSFREVPRTVSVHLEIDRSRSPKVLKLEITFPQRKLYVFQVEYNISLRNPLTGDYKLNIVTPDRRARSWNNVKGSWDFTNHNDATLVFELGHASWEAKGKFGLRESKFVVQSTSSSRPGIHVEWRFHKTSTPTERTRDHYFKAGTEERFVMLKLKGKYSGLTYGESESAFQISRFMPSPLELNATWKRDDTGLSGEGDFKFGPHEGTFTLKKLKREASTRSVVLSFEARTNIIGYNKITVEGEYNFDHKAVLKLDIVWDTSKISINFDIQNITGDFTEQTASFFLPGIGDVDITFGHDFRNRRKKTFTVIGHLKGRESHIKAEWTRNRDGTKFSGKVDSVSILLGHIVINAEYDVRNLGNANADIQYTRNDEKNVHIKWFRKRTSNSLEAEVTFESHFRLLPSAKIAVNINFRQGFDVNILLKGPTKEITLVVNLVENSLSGELTTPIPGFEKITGSFTYNVSDRKRKTAVLKYQRGDRIITMDLSLETPSRRAGKLNLSLATPFEFVRTLSLDASWKNRKGEVHYKRNDISYSFSGDAEVKTDRSSFEIKFTPNNSDPINISFNFNAGSLISGQGTELEDIAEFKLGLLGKRVGFEMKGFRNSERIVIEIEAESSLERVTHFEIKLDSELNTQQRNGMFEIKVNDFHFKIKNHFERRPQNGYYWKSEIESTLTRLPGLIIGFGREGEERILTVGVGEDRELTVAFTPKENFKKGFSGKLSLPRRGIIDAAYDVNYSFSGNDILNIGFQIQLEPGRVIEADIVYNSDGVRARLSSPRTGRHSVRVRRSVTDNGFYAEAGFDNYSMSIRGDLLNADLKRGFVLDGEIFGTKFTIDTLFQCEGSRYVEGKFIIQTNIEGYEKLGGMFTLSNIDKQIHARTEINLPSYVTPKVYGSVDLDLDNKFKGIVSVDISGEVFVLHCDLNGNFKNGYEGQIQFRTPFRGVSQTTISGQLQVNSPHSFVASLHIDQFIRFRDVLVKLDINPRNAFVEAKAECAQSGKSIHVILKYKVEHNNATAEFMINENRVELDFNINPTSTINFNLDISSSYISSPISLSVTGHRNSATITLNLDQRIHTLSAKLDKIDNEIDFNLLINTPWIPNERRMIAIKYSLPRNYLTDDSFVRVTYTDEATHDLVARVDRNNGLKITVTLDSPLGNSNIEFEFNISGGQQSVNFIVESPFGNHKAFLSINQNLTFNHHTRRMNGDLHLETEISSSFLTSNFSYSLTTSMTNEKKMSEQTLIYGGIKQSLNAGYSYTSNAVLLVLDIETPLLNINKASLNAELSLSNIIRTSIVANFQEQDHTIDVKCNIEENYVTALIRSPYIAGGLAKAEFSAEGSSIRDIELVMAFKMNRKTLAAKLRLKAPSLNNMSTELEVKTPFRGYRKMNFGASFVNDDITRAVFFATKPIGYRFEITTGKTIEGYNTEINMETQITGFETISAVVQVPLNKTAPKIFLKLPTAEYGLDFEVECQEFTRKINGNLNLNGLSYGAGFGLRTKAPYEVSLQYRIQNLFSRFHIMADSSFLSMFSLFL